MLDNLETLPGAIEFINSGLQGIESASPADAFRMIAKVASSASRQWQENSGIAMEMKSELLDDLFNGQLIATGYRVAQKRSRDPVEIDPNLFDDPEIDWRHSIVRGLAQEFHNVRISSPLPFPDVDKGGRKGRPGSGTAIKAAIERVASRNPDFCKLNRAQAANEIRKELSITEIPGNGLSDQNLAKYIRAKCGNKQISE